MASSAMELGHYVGALPVVLLHALQEMRADEKLCDVLLCAGETKIPAHRVILAAVSPFFRAMFTSGFPDTNMYEIPLKQINPDALSPAIDFIYTARLRVVEDMVSVLELAEFLQISTLKCACSDYLIKHLKPSDRFTISRLAGTLNLPQLQEAAEKCMAQVVIDVYNNLPSSRGCKLLKNDIREQIILVAGGEEWQGMYLRNAECWAKQDGSYRWRHSLPPKSGEEELPSHTIPVMRECRVFPAFASSSKELFVAGGKWGRRILTSMEKYVIDDNTWLKLKQLPTPLFGAAATLTNGALWVIGGETPDGWDNKVLIYNPETDKWHNGPELPEKRIFHSAISWHNAIYVIGGKTEKDVGATTSVLLLESGASSWVPVASMQKPRAFFGCTIAHGFIYVVGGSNGIHTMQNAERYNLTGNQWSAIADYSIPVESCGVATMVCPKGEEHVMCIGGSDGEEQINRVEKLGMSQEEWHCLSSELSIPRSGFAVGVFTKVVRRTRRSSDNNSSYREPRES